jgi:hypothetical protein
MNTNPYTPIKTLPLGSSPTGKPEKIAVHLPDPTEDSGWRRVGSIPLGQPVLPNTAIRKMALEIGGRCPMQWKEAKVFFDGTRFAYALVTQGGPVAAVGGERLRLGLLFQNSYDATWAPSMRLMAFIGEEEIGVLSNRSLPRVFFQGSAHTDTWANDLKEALALFDEGEALLHALSNNLWKLNAWCLQEAELLQLQWLWPGGSSPAAQSPVTTWLLQNKKGTAWTLLQALLRQLWKQQGSSSSAFRANAAYTDGLLALCPEPWNERQRHT